MSEKKFANGEIVRLKSGGPRMTVSKVSESGESMDCVWIHNGAQMVDTFKAATLDIVRPERTMKAFGADEGHTHETVAAARAQCGKEVAEFIAEAIEWVGAAPCEAMAASKTMTAIDEGAVLRFAPGDVKAFHVHYLGEAVGDWAQRVSNAKGAQKVSGDDIETMVKRLTFEYVDRPGGSTVTFCHAFLDGFFVASGMSACVDPLIFDQTKGRMFATENAVQAARDELWKLEGYLLHCRRQGRFDCMRAGETKVTVDVKLGEDGALMAEGVAPASDIGAAARALLDGKRVARRAWGAAGDKWISMTGASRVKADNFWSKPNADYARTLPDGVADVPASITVKSGPGEISMGWHATPADVLAHDWYVVEEGAPAASKTGRAFVRKGVPLEAR